MKHNILFLLFLNLLFISLTFASSSGESDILDDFLQQMEEDKLKVTPFIKIIKEVDQKTTEQPSNKAHLRNRMGKILTEYAKALFYGKLDDGKPKIQKAFYYFKLASQYGNSESLYYLSFYAFYDLNGRFLYLHNYQTLDKEDQHASLYNYLNKMNATTLLTNSYIASLQGHNTSTYLLGNLFWHGWGVKSNCQSAALYFKNLAQMYFVEDEANEYTSPVYLEKKRLDGLYFNEQEQMDDGFFSDSPHERDYILMSAELNNLQYIIQAGNIYYYGRMGLKRNFQKAFDYYYRAAQMGEPNSMVAVGRMLMEGLGVEKNVESGLKFLREADMKDNPAGRNVLGKLYFLGKGVKQDVKKAMMYFKDAAYANSTDAQYNYAVGLLRNGDDKDVAMKFLNQAALQGHVLAMFHLGLLYLEGTHLYYSCDMGTSLIRSACERGPWAKRLLDGYHFYKQKQPKLALLHYMEAAFLGYDIANSNGALIISSHQVFKEKDLDVKKRTRKISEDPIWIALSETENYKPPKNHNEVLYQDIIEVLSSLKYSEAKQKKILDHLTEPFKNIDKKYNTQLMLQLLSMGVQLSEPLSTLKLGDIYQEGKLVDKNETLAYEYYARLDRVNILQTYPTILSHAYYNMAYMNHYGLGRAKNLTKAIIFYNLSLSLENSNYYWNTMNMKLAEWEKEYYKKFLNLTGDGLDKSMSPGELVMANLVYFEEHYAKKVFMSFLVLAVSVLFLIRLRLKNYSDIYLREHSH